MPHRHVLPAAVVLELLADLERALSSARSPGPPTLANLRASLALAHARVELARSRCVELLALDEPSYLELRLRARIAVVRAQLAALAAVALPRTMFPGRYEDLASLTAAVAARMTAIVPRERDRHALVAADMALSQLLDDEDLATFVAVGSRSSRAVVRTACREISAVLGG